MIIDIGFIIQMEAKTNQNLHIILAEQTRNR